MIENIENMTLKEKCYAYQHEANFFLDDDKYIIAHLDGRSFSTLVKNRFEKPFDDFFIDTMNKVAIYLCEQVNGVQFAYVQSDEISLIIKKTNPEGQVFFGGRVCKMQSIMASLATCKFNQLMMLHEAQKIKKASRALCATIPFMIENATLYQFDCKVWNVDSANDAMAWILFRNIDCVRNSKQQTAQTYVKHKELLNKNTDEQIQLCFEKSGVNWHDFDNGKKYGRIVKRTMKYLTTESGIDYIRHAWEATPGVDLTQQDDRMNLVNELNMIDIYGDDN